jgi:hypothetical protein
MTGPADAGADLRTWVDGQLVPARGATVSAYDRGFRNGEGVFETFPDPLQPLAEESVHFLDCDPLLPGNFSRR